MANTLDKKHLTPISQTELDVAIKKHAMYASAKVGGARAILSYKDLSGLVLRGVDLSSADFSGSLFYDADMRNCKMEGSVFFCANLQKAHLNDARLARIDLRGANVQGVDFSGADLTQADMREGSMATKDRRGNIKVKPLGGAASGKADSKKTDVPVYTDDVDAREALFIGTKMHRAMLRGARMQGAIFENADLTGAQMDGASLREAVLLNTTLDGIELSQVDFAHALRDEIQGLGIEDTFEPLPQLFTKHAVWVESGGVIGTRLDLTRYDLRAHKSQYIDFKEQNLIMMKARQAIFYHVRFSGAQIQACDFRNCDFRLALFDKADLRGSDFSGSNMMRARFQLALLYPLKLPDGRIVPTNMSNCNLRYADFTGADLKSVNFTGADLSYADMRGTNLAGADITGAITENTLF
ncbi:MAG: pentapeptide repeat-containing protein [Alphaproteobacteria bacterium]|nr:pentapeptide repeat-containing protein [Alphaproteobacteria bacterium]